VRVTLLKKLQLQEGGLIELFFLDFRDVSDSLLLISIKVINQDCKQAMMSNQTSHELFLLLASVTLGVLILGHALDQARHQLDALN
jgi:hypothetical protein